MLTPHPEWPQARDELLADAHRLEALAADLRLLADHLAPTAEVLETAPLLDQFTFTTRPIACLTGHQTGHPIAKGKLIVTSGLWVMAKDFSWARTMSRFYRLGRPKGVPNRA